MSRETRIFPFSPSQPRQACANALQDAGKGLSAVPASATGEDEGERENEDEDGWACN